MDDLPEYDHPRCRGACKAWDCIGGRSYAEVLKPDASLGPLGWERAPQWQEETWEIEFDAMCPYLRAIDLDSFDVSLTVGGTVLSSIFEVGYFRGLCSASSRFYILTHLGRVLIRN